MTIKTRIRNTYRKLFTLLGLYPNRWSVGNAFKVYEYRELVDPAGLGREDVVLDLGCGTGRDTQAILEAGFGVTAIDGSAEMAAEARKRTGRPVLVMLFEDMPFNQEFDGVWASASLLHVPRAGLPDVLRRVHTALKPGGWLEAGFKSGGHEGRDGLGRYYNYLNPEELEPMLRAAGHWSSLELKTGRGKGYDGTETGWVEALARKSADAG